MSEVKSHDPADYLVDALMHWYPPVDVESMLGTAAIMAGQPSHSANHLRTVAEDLIENDARLTEERGEI